MVKCGFITMIAHIHIQTPNITTDTSLLNSEDTQELQIPGGVWGKESHFCAITTMNLSSISV